MGFGCGYTLADDTCTLKTHHASQEFEAECMLSQRMTRALNCDMLSPLTLCAAGHFIGIDGYMRALSDEDELKKRKMLQFLIDKMKIVKWTYG